LSLLSVYSETELGTCLLRCKMAFEYHYENNEANFGKPLPNQVEGGMHITFEIVLKKEDKFIALRRPRGIPNHRLPSHARDHPEGLLFFCHDLIRYGEPVEDCVKRIVLDQAGVEVESFRLIEIDSALQDDKTWALTPHVIAEIKEIPKTTSEVTEVIVFDNNNIPDNFAWWTKEEVSEFITE